MTELEKEADEQAKKLEENQTLGVYDRDEDLEYDKGWNAGEVSGYRDGYIAGAEPREKRIEELEATNKKISDECHKLVDTLEKKQKEISELEKENEETQELLDKQIEATYKLDKENAELKEQCSDEECLKRLCKKGYIKFSNEHIAELEKANAELLCQKNRNKSCYSCANATERCFRNEIGCPCEKYKSYKDENAELKDDNTKAKETIKGLLELGSIGDGDYIYVEEAEDFIKE